QAGRLVFANPALARLLGAADPADLVGRPAQDFVDPETWPVTQERLARIAAGQSILTPILNRYRRLDGQLVDVEVTGVPSTHQEQGAAQVMVQDVTERRRAEAALRESEARYRLLAEHMADVVWLLDVDTQRFKYVSPSVTGLLGYSVAEVLSRTLTDLISDASLDLIRTALPERLAAFQAGDPAAVTQRHEVEQLRQDGSPVWTEVLTTVLWNEAGGLDVLGVSRDIVERKRAEAALRESEARYRGLFEHMLDGVAYCRMIFAAGLPQDWIYLKVNPAFEALTGLRGAEGRRVSEVIPNIRATDPNLFEIYGRVALTGHPERFETYVAALEMWFDVHVFSPEREHFVAVFDVITERKRAEAALRESEARYRNLIDHAPDAIFINRDNRIVLVNAAALRLFGAAAPAQLLGRAPYDLFHADDHAAIRERIRRLVELAEPALPREERIVRVDGGVVDVEVSAAPFQDQGLPAIHVILRDITERKRAAEELRQAQDLTQLALGAGEIGIWRNDLTTGQVYLDKRARAHYGVDRSELPLAGILERVHSADRERLAQEITAATAPTSSGRFATEYRVVHPDASEHWLAVGVRVWFEGTGPERRATMGFGTSQDITERKRQAAASERQLAMLDALYTQAHQLAQTLDPVQVAASVVRQCGETFGARLAWLGVAEPDGRVEVLAHFPLEDDYPRQVRVRWDTAPEGFGPTGRALRERAPVISTDLEAPTYAVWRSATAQRGFRASAAFPLVSREQPLGALNLYSDQPDFFSAERVALFQAFAQQAAAALANARLFQAVSEQREQLRGLAARVAEVEESERRSLARELHDRVGANLTALNISLTIVRGRLSAETLAVAGPRLDDALTLLQETMVQVRDVMMDLRPSVLDDYGLLAALRWYAQQLGRRSGQTVLVANAGAEPRLPAAAETALFRVAQEALTNVIKHARAAQAEVRLETDAGRARLVIADDGVGFDPGLRRGGWGMVNMRERVEAVGGRLHVESQPGRGAMITVEVDL
ncbi:MAG: PAS domain S-box protein, partial [Anaerolineales bacterium]|nr:PAS domain S-box protein [Anaerolineales bacterium]